MATHLSPPDLESDPRRSNVKRRHDIFFFVKRLNEVTDLQSKFPTPAWTQAKAMGYWRSWVMHLCNEIWCKMLTKRFGSPQKVWITNAMAKIVLLDVLCPPSHRRDSPTFIVKPDHQTHSELGVDGTCRGSSAF